MNIILKLLISSFINLLAGGVVVTPVIALMNYLAEDGPIFPAPLVALLVVLPIMVILFVIQVGALLYEGIKKRDYGATWIAIGLAGGLGAGLILYLVLIAPFQEDILWPTIINLGVAGTFQGIFAGGSQWILSKLQPGWKLWKLWT
jgi:hypothetical protein